MIKYITLLILILSSFLTCLEGRESDNITNISAQVWKNQESINAYLPAKTEGNYNKHNIKYNIPYSKFLIGNMGLKAYSQQNPQLKVSHPLVKIDATYYHNYTEVNGQIGYEFYISDDKVMSRIDYHTSDWVHTDSEYIRYHCSSDKAIAKEAMFILDERIEEFFTYFPQRNHELDSLRIHKLDYFYCPDLNTIELLTSYKTRGILFLNQDYVVSTYPAHFHEVTHFLINYYLKNNEIYTHTFLQEGLAVALGGRGGQSTDALMEAGKFLLDTGMVTHTDYFDAIKFQGEHPSLSYPVAGLLTRIMLDHYSVDEYLTLYKRYSNSEGKFDIIEELDWLTKDVIDEYVQTNNFRSVYFSAEGEDFLDIYNGQSLKISASKEMFQFKSIGDINFDFANNSFKEVANGRYSLNCSSQEIKLTDNLLDEIISSWSINFTLTGEEIPFKGGYYQFYLKKSIFR